MKFIKLSYIKIYLKNIVRTMFILKSSNLLFSCLANAEPNDNFSSEQKN